MVGRSNLVFLYPWILLVRGPKLLVVFHSSIELGIHVGRQLICCGFQMISDAVGLCSCNLHLKYVNDRDRSILMALKRSIFYNKRLLHLHISTPSSIFALVYRCYEWCYIVCRLTSLFLRWWPWGRVVLHVSYTVWPQQSVLMILMFFLSSFFFGEGIWVVWFS